MSIEHATLPQGVRRKVAFIGAGQMGGRCARRVLHAGHELVICDPVPKVQEAFASEGAEIARTPADCGAADIVIFFVMTGADAKNAAFGESGLLSGVDAAKPPLVLIMSTVMPDDAHEIAAGLAERGVRTIDAPVTGAPALADQGKLLILVGGDSADIDYAQPVLEAIGREIVRCGDFTRGLIAKILNNMLGISTMYLMQECFRLGEAYGMSPHNVAEIIEKGMGRNAWTRDVASTISSLDALSQDPDYFAKMLKACLKDWNCAIALGDKVNVQLPFLRGMMSTVDEVDGHALHSEWRKFVDRNASPS